MDDGSLGPDLQAKFTTFYGNLINHCKAEITKKPTVHLSLTPDDRSISDEVSMPDEAQYWHILQNDSSHVLDSSIAKEKSSGMNIGTSTSKNEDNCAKKVVFLFTWIKTFYLFISFFVFFLFCFVSSKKREKVFFFFYNCRVATVFQGNLGEKSRYCLLKNLKNNLTFHTFTIFTQINKF